VPDLGSRWFRRAIAGAREDAARLGKRAIVQRDGAKPSNDRAVHAFAAVRVWAFRSDRDHANGAMLLAYALLLLGAVSYDQS